MDVRVSEAIPHLIAAVQTIFDPSVSHQSRLAAQQVCENFKDKSPVCIECGLVLSEKSYPAITRHFGLQLIEHCVKFRWDDVAEPKIDMLKQSCFRLIVNGTESLLQEQNHIKDALSRVVVEIIKQLYPQMWPNLLKELCALCQRGATQAELVLKILLRLVEDVVSFQSLPYQRCQEVRQAITASIGELCKLFVNLLQTNVTAFQEITQNMTIEPCSEAMCHGKVCQAVLETLTGFLDWIPVSHIMNDNGVLLQMMCLLLNNKLLQLHAAECLLLIASRKGKLDDRKPLLILFSDDAMSVIWNATVAAANEAMKHDEYYYLFLKKLCQVLIEIGKQLCVLWGTANDVKRPETFPKYLEAVLAFTDHPSQMLGSFTQSLWITILKHETINKDEIFLSCIQKLMQATAKTLLKVGYPSHSNHRSCDYSRFDFDSDEEFNMFFAKYRNAISDSIRFATLLQPATTFNLAAQWLKSVLEKPIDAGDGKNYCNLSSPSYLEWDAMSLFLECVMSKLRLAPDPKPADQESVLLLQCLLKYETQDPLILSTWLSCISSLFYYITFIPESLPVILQKILAAVVFNIPGQTKSTRSKGVKNCRQHACSALVRICKSYPDFIFPVFNQLYEHIKGMCSDPDELSQMEKCILTESLLLISNKFCDFNKQSSFVEEILAPVRELWMSPEVDEAFWNPAAFMSYFGLDEAPVEPSTDDTCGINRCHITNSISVILGVMKRVTWPGELEVAEKGGFVLRIDGKGKPIYRNPATKHVYLLLEKLFSLLRTLNSLWLPDYIIRRHKAFEKAYDLLESERLSVLGIPPSCTDNTENTSQKQPIERMQTFFSHIFEHAYHILGNAGMCLGQEFYASPKLSQMLLDSVFTNIEHIPDYRLKPIIRVFMKPFIQHCSSEYYATAVVPLLDRLCPLMYQRLGMKWHQINQIYVEISKNDADDDREAEEILDEQITRQITREYIDMLGAVCYNRKQSQQANVAAVDMKDENMMEDGEASEPSNYGKDESLSELGQIVLNSEDLCTSVVLCVYNGLSWEDSSTCNKCIGLCWPITKQIVAIGNVSSEAACHFMTSILHGLQTHGQHEACQGMLLALGTQVYELLRPKYKEVKDLLRQVLGCDMNSLQSFDDRLMAATQKQFPEKKKKEAFKKIVSGIIGKSIGQQFKRDTQYKALPPIFKKSKPRKPALDETETENLGICALFTPSSDLKNSHNIE